MFDIPYLYHTGAGKINANLRTVAVFVYEQFRSGAKIHQPDYGIAGAASVLLFIITAALGMLVFRHKTKHWYFVWGIPLILLAQIALAVWVYFK